MNLQDARIVQQISPKAIIDGTGTCFDDINEIVAFLKKRGYHPHRLLIVHALILRKPIYDGTTKKMERSAHAWVEQGDFMWEVGILNGHKRLIVESRIRERYEDLGVTETHKYTIKEAVEMSAKNGDTTGPWRKDLVLICAAVDKDRKNEV